MSAINNNVPSLALEEKELVNVLRNSLYPGAQDASIKMVIGYCKASSLDPMQKPVHIVPIYDAKSSSYRDVVMPGIGLYRIQAARSGEYAGVTDPEFGPDVTETIGGQQITFPSWCRVSVKRMLSNGTIAEFSATERWKENYAQKGGKERSIAPNAMWSKRPYGQLSKCAEAQALRKAFPEVGSQPTAEEMEGKPMYEEQESSQKQQQQPEASIEYEAQYLPILEDAADFGMEALTKAFKPIPVTKEKKLLWDKHSEKLKAKAAAADAALVGGE